MSETGFITRGAKGGSKPGGGGGSGGPAGILEFTPVVTKDDGGKGIKGGVLRPPGLGGLAKPAVHGLLKWGAETYAARVCLPGFGGLPAGLYWVDGGPRKGSLGGGTRDPGKGGSGSGGGKGDGGKGDAADPGKGTRFAIPIAPQGNASLDGLFIHEARGRMYTSGIELVGADAAEFWQRWQGTARNRRPGRLQVGTGKDGGKDPVGVGGGDGGKGPHGGGGGGGGKVPRLFG